jgi:predicted amidophosphoribosyltransferase
VSGVFLLQFWIIDDNIQIIIEQGVVVNREGKYDIIKKNILDNDYFSWWGRLKEKDDNWWCKKCDQHHKFYRKNCKKCGEVNKKNKIKKHDINQKENVIDNENYENGEKLNNLNEIDTIVDNKWICGKCENINYFYLSYCKKCNKKRDLNEK